MALNAMCRRDQDLWMAIFPLICYYIVEWHLCDILAQGLIGLIEYSYHQGIPSFPETHL
jgi:hypothetical protein